MTITLSKKFDFCGCKNVYMNENRIGDVIRYNDGTFEIRVSKLHHSTVGKLKTVYRTIKTNNESMIINLISNFINQH